MFQIKKIIKDCMFFALLLALLTICWIYFLDGVIADQWRNFEIIGSVAACIFTYSICHFIIMYFVPFNFLCENILKCIVLVILWFAFGYFFDWYDSDNWYCIFLYTTPIYIIAYIYDLYTLKRDADFVNKKL